MLSERTKRNQTDFLWVISYKLVLKTTKVTERESQVPEISEGRAWISFLMVSPCQSPVWADGLSASFCTNIAGITN